MKLSIGLLFPLITVLPLLSSTDKTLDHVVVTYSPTYQDLAFNGATSGDSLEVDVSVLGSHAQYAALVLNVEEAEFAGKQLFLKVQSQGGRGQFDYGACYLGTNGSSGAFGLGFFELNQSFSSAHMKAIRRGSTATIEFTNIDGGTKPNQTYVCEGAPRPSGFRASITTSTHSPLIGFHPPTSIIQDPAPPTITGVSPFRNQGGTTNLITLSGTNFVPGGTDVIVRGPGTDPAKVLSVSVNSASQLNFSVLLPCVLVGGGRVIYGVSVQTAAGKSNTQAIAVDSCISITSENKESSAGLKSNVASTAAPTLTNLTPNFARICVPKPATLSGTGFVTGSTTVNIEPPASVSYTVVDGDTIFAVFDHHGSCSDQKHFLVTVTTAEGTSNSLPFNYTAAGCACTDK